MPVTITRRDLVRGLAAGCAAAALPRFAVADDKKSSRPNILLITADDMNYDSVGIYGCKVANITPNIDKLASEGIRFTHAHVTAAVCQPSRSVLMTGRYPHRNGAEGFEPINLDVPTLQESLRAGGYLNGIMAKNTHLWPREKFCWDYYVTPEELGHGRSPSLYYQRAKEFFQQSKAAGKPFFLMANSQDPHRPFAGSERELKAFGKHMPFSREIKPAEAEIPGFLPDIPDVRKEIAQYFTSIHRCDETVGEVLRALKETGCRDNTLVMFLSDNGMAFPYSKTNCYLNSTATPWMVRWPGHTKPGQVDSDHFISGIDYMPTILEAAGLKQVDGMDGRSFLPLIRGEDQKDRDKVFTQFHITAAWNEYPMRAVQNRKYGYVFNAWSDGKRVFRNESQSGLTFRAMEAAGKTDPEIEKRVEFFQYRTPEEFYDLEADPDALHNLIDDLKHQADIEKMRRQILEYMTSSKDPLLPVYKTWCESRVLTWQPGPKQRKEKKRK